MWLAVYYTLVLHITAITCADHVSTGCWPNNIIPYKLFYGFNARQVKVINDQIREMNRLSCVRWVNLEYVPANETDYVAFKKAKVRSTCRTTKGKVPSGEEAVKIELGSYCFSKGVILHEMLHVMGFPHEHQRADRDCYLVIDYERADLVGEAGAYAIKQTPWLERFPYDKSSLMHYPRNVLMKARTERWYSAEPLGNADDLSFLDLWKVQYRFCGFPHFCEVFPPICFFIEDTEKSCVQPVPVE